MVEFSITGDYSEDVLNTITDSLGVTPNITYLKGDIIKRNNRKRIESCWEINTGYEESYDINDQIYKILPLIYNKREILKDLMVNYNLQCLLMIVISIENNKKPKIHLKRDVIEFMNDIKSEIDFDIYDCYSLENLSKPT
ncbi:hypothetical protein CLPU_9c00760 [Gottschalkia purinilytica]|uniref:DUF4279 domain-containing protein n=1 Tax=Gottschalkia purinilytica TaxID=1503 RepID=A0A0L0WA39_GOTPU|nr:DUF4279 domain-containing protein [Gottschalkia purinilytica]KNF08180.1 hypothetical protein CLPU_9c00760 [Gottschalkia purinilytica]